MKTLKEFEAINEYYFNHRDDIIDQLRKELDPEHIPEDDDTLENWYKPALINIASDWMESEEESADVHHLDATCTKDEEVDIK